MSGSLIEFADGWRERPASGEAPRLLAETSGRLCLLENDFSLVHDFGGVGPVDCPLAYDPEKGLAFRYICATGQGKGDFSQIRAFSMDRRDSFAVKHLPPNQWVLWFLEWVGSDELGTGQLFGLVATDRPVDDRILIEHRLFTHRVGEDLLRLRPLCRDAYKPLAFSRKRRELIFSGADGVYLLNLKGERICTLPGNSAATGHGAAFAPDGSGRVVLGGDGLHLWDLERNSCVRLTRNGRHPVWSPEGHGIWYRESSGDLCFFDFERDAKETIVRPVDQKHPDFWHARPVSLSRCGRFLATSFTRKRLRGVSLKGSASGQRERVYEHRHVLCALDLVERSYWFRDGLANQLRWLD